MSIHLPDVGYAQVDLRHLVCISPLCCTAGMCAGPLLSLYMPKCVGGPRFHRLRYRMFNHEGDSFDQVVCGHWQAFSYSRPESQSRGALCVMRRLLVMLWNIRKRTNVILWFIG